MIVWPSKSLFLAAKVICPVETLSKALVISTLFVLKSASGSNASIADIPCGIVLVCNTQTFLSASLTACSAAIIIFLLFGRTNTISAGQALIAARMSSVEGFIVWPPLTTQSTPMSENTASRPSPAATATKPYCFSGGAGLNSCLACFCLCSCCNLIFSTFGRLMYPNSSPFSIALPGLFV